MTSRPLHCVALLALAASSAVAAESRLVFREAFDGTANQPAGYTESCWVSEFPPSLKWLSFRPSDGKGVDVYKGAFVLPPGVPACTNYEFAFRFAFPGDGARAFTLSLATGDRTNVARGAWTQVAISDKAMSIRPPAAGLLPAFGAAAQDTDIGHFPRGVWHRALVRVRSGTMELLVENDGVLRKFAQAECGSGPLAGFNLRSAAPLDLDDIEIRRIEPAGRGPFRSEGAVEVANSAAEFRIDVPAGASSAAVSFRIGTYPGAAVLVIGFADGSNRVVDARTFASSYSRATVRSVNELGADGKLVATTKVVRVAQVLPDAGLQLRERRQGDPRLAWSLACHTRPKLEYRYEPDRELAIASGWESFPAASQTFVSIELRPDPAGAQLWLNGRYAGRLDSTARVDSVSITLPAGGAVRDAAVSSAPRGERYLALDVGRIANPGLMADAKLSPVGPGPRPVEGVPFIVADGASNADLGVCRENLGTFALECDGYLSRTPFDGMPESLMLSVPVAQYMRAWVLCAVENDPDKVPVITARLTKFLPGSAVGRGPAIADTEMALPRPGDTLPAGVRKVGEVTTGGRRVPLYLVELALDSGSIQDIIFQEKPAWLDFELLGKRNDKDNFYFDRSRKPSDDISGVHVFGVTLERSPVEMAVAPAAFGNVYEPRAKAAMTATLRAREKTGCTLAWKVRDIRGRVLDQGGRTIRFPGPGEQAVETVFAQAEPGWYAVDYALTGADGRDLLRHTAFFARVPGDTREAGYESPYFSWNFGGAHGTIADIAVTGPLLLNAGIRHTHVASEVVGAPWKLSLGQFPRIGPRSRDPQEAAKELEAAIRANVEKSPRTTMALVFHESGGGPFPLELIGGKTPVDEKQAAYDRAVASHLNQVASAYRRVAPHVKLVVGNSGTATPGLLASLFRAGAPREQIDFLGEETVGMTIPPELSVARENWILRETARVFGYGDIPVSACYEWKCRRSRHLGLERYAEWTVRDLLIGHAWRQPLIPVPGLPDVANSYYNSVWGDGAFTHNPQVYPKPTYPAVATATRVLDRAVFSKMIPTGSRTVYALEFTRPGQVVYALWTARGETEATLDFGRDVDLGVTELYGRASTVKTRGGIAVVPVGEGACYVAGPTPLKAVTALGERRFPRETPPAGLELANRMDRADEWTLDARSDPRIELPADAAATSRSFRRPGSYALREVADEQRGACLELELLRTNDCPALVQEYAVVRLAKPVGLSGAPRTIGIWVKGNSSWGKLFWEIEDAEGERWLSAGSGGYGCDAYDWPEQAGLNFDGWHFVQFPIERGSPIAVPSPGQDRYQWQHDGTGNRRIDYPIKATALAVSMPRQALNLLEMEPVAPAIRLGGLGAY